MVQRNRENELFSHTDVFTKEQHFTDDAAVGSIGRRNFLAGGLMATAALTVVPLTPGLVMPPPLKFNWEFLKQIATAVATILGYGSLAQNILRSLECGGNLRTMVGKMNLNGFLDPCQLPADAPKVGAEEREPAHHAIYPPANRFWVMAPHTDRYNGLSLFFDRQKSQEPTGRLSLPTLHYFQKVPDALRTLGYRDRTVLRQALLPHEQSRAAEGRFQQSYSESDKYRALDNGEFEFKWETAGRGEGTLRWSGRLRNQNTGRMTTLRDLSARATYEPNLVSES